MKYTCLVLFLVLLLRTSTQSTLYVDNIDHNYITTEVPTFDSETANVVLADTVRFALQPTAGLNIETSGPVQLTGSFAHIESDGALTQNAGGDFTLDGADSFSVLTSKLNITAADDFTMTTVSSTLEVNVGGSVEAFVDQAYIVGTASVSINSGGGNVDLYSDHLVQVHGENTNILGENRVTFQSLYDVSINAVNSFESRSNLLDFNTLGDIRLASSTANVKFVAGSELIMEGEVIVFSANEGVDVNSLHGDIFVNAGRDVLISSLDTVDFEIIDDANFISQNGEFAVSANQFAAHGRERVHIDASNLVSTSQAFNVETFITNIDTHGSIQFHYTGSGVEDSLFNAEEDLQISANVVRSESSNLLISTSRDEVLEGDIIFQSNSIDESLFNSDSKGDTSFSAASRLSLLSGTIDNSAETISFEAQFDLNIKAEYKTFDFVNMKSPEIVLGGRDATIDGNIGIVESKTDATFTHEEALTLEAGLKDGTASFESQSTTDLSIDALALFQSRFNSRWSGYNTDVDLKTFFESQVFDDTKIYSSNSRFLAKNDISVESHFNTYVSDNMRLQTTAGDIVFSSDNFDFWANEEGSVTSKQGASFNFIDDLTFRAFADLSIDNLSSLFASSFLGFESNEFIEVLAENIHGAASSSIHLTTNARHPLRWTGKEFNSTSNAVYFDAPSSTYSALKELTLSADTVDVSTVLERSIKLTTGDDLRITVKDGGELVNSGNHLYLSTLELSLTSANGSVSTTADWLIDHEINEYSGESNDLIVNSADHVIIHTVDPIIVDTLGGMTWAINRDTLINSFNFELVNEDSFYQVNEFTLSANSPEYYEDGQIYFEAGEEFAITLSGSFSQQGGSVVYNIGASDNIAAASSVSINSIDGSVVTVNNGNLTLDATPADSTIRFHSMDYVVNANLSINFLAGDLDIASNRTQNIIFDSAHDVIINTANEKAFTWTSRDDINSTVGNYTVRANRKDSEGNSISFKTTHEEGNVVVNVRSGWLNLQSRDSQTYSAHFIELFAANDLTFNTSLALSPNTGGITFTTDGFAHHPVAGEKAGISFTSTGIQGFIYLEAPLGKETYQAGYDMAVIAREGSIDILANQEIDFTSTKGNVLISSADRLSFITDTGDINFQTTEGNTELRASSDINLTAAANIYLTSTDPITKASGRAFEFAASSGHINVRAESDSNINWNAGGDIFTQSAEATTHFASEGIFYTASNGRYLAASKTGIKLQVENGDLNLNASDSVNFSSANNWDIFVASGRSSHWVAQSKSIDISTAEDTTLHTERNDVKFNTLQGNILVDSTGQIRFQAGGTDSNPSGSNVDGIFVNAPNVDVRASDQAIIESEARVDIGANTNPVVKLEAGGSGAATGVEMTAEGNALFTIQDDLKIQSGGNLFMAAARQFDLQSGGSISISTTGTDESGKDFTIRTFSELDMNAQEAFINGHDAVNVLSFDVISFKTTGTDPVTSNIEISAALDFVIEIDDRMDVDGAIWSTVAEEGFDIVILSDLLFTNFPSPTGEISIYADHSLDFVCDTFMNVSTTGPNSEINLTTQGSSSDLLIQTGALSSDINFATLGAFFSQSVNDIDFQTTESLTFTSYDNIDDGVENGKIDLFSPDDFESSSNTLTLQGNEGVSFITANRADVTLQSAGLFSIKSFEEILFDSVNGKLSLNANENLIFETFPGQGGDITISTTRDLLLTSDDRVHLDFGGDLTTSAQTINFNANSGYLSVITQGASGDLSFDADVIALTGGKDSYLFASDIAFSAVDTVLLRADNDLTLSTIGNHAHISYSSNELLSISAPKEISFHAYSGAGRSNDEFQYYDYYSHNGHGYMSFIANGANPQFKYGVLVNSTDVMSIQAVGSVVFHAPESVVSLEADQGISMTASTTYQDKKSIRFSALGTNSKALFNATGDLSITSAYRTSVFADKSIQFYPYGELSIQSQGVQSGDEPRTAIEILSTHPNADIFMQTTDFLTGNILYKANGIEVYGEQGLEFHLEDDDDAEQVGLFQVSSNRVSFEAQDNGLVRTFGGGDIVIDAEVALHVHAGDDLYVTVSNQFRMLAINLDIQTVTPVRFQVGDNYLLRQSSSDDTDYNVGGDTIIFADQDLDISGNAISLIAGSENLAPHTLSVLAREAIEITANSVQIVTQRQRAVDFVDGLIVPTFNAANVVHGGPCGTDRQFLVDTAPYHQICYCNSITHQWNCAQTMHAFFPY